MNSKLGCFEYPFQFITIENDDIYSISTKEKNLWKKPIKNFL